MSGAGRALGIGQELCVSYMHETPWASGREGSFGKPSFSGCHQTCKCISRRYTFCQYSFEAGILSDHPGNSLTLLTNRQRPAYAALFRPITPFEQMNKQHLRATFQLSCLGPGQALHLFCQILPIESFSAVSPQRPSLPQRPRIVVAFIKILAKLQARNLNDLVRHRSLFPFRLGE